MAVLLGGVGATKKNYHVDKELIDDLFMFMENDLKILNSYERSFLPNIATKIGQGKLDINKLPKLFEYLYKNNLPTIKRYYSDVKLNPSEREYLGQLWSEKAIEDIKYNYDQLYSGRTGKYEPIEKFTKGKTIGRVLMGSIKSYRDCLKHEFHKLKSKKAMPQKQKVAVALNVCSPKL